MYCPKIHPKFLKEFKLFHWFNTQQFFELASWLLLFYKALLNDSCLVSQTEVFITTDASIVNYYSLLYFYLAGIVSSLKQLLADTQMPQFVIKRQK